MPLLDLNPDQLLTTTRSVRKRLDLDRPVDPAIVDECLRVALQAPSGSNQQGWHWIVVTDPDLRAGIGDHYRQASAAYFENARAEMEASEAAGADPVAARTRRRVHESAVYLAENLHRVPVHILGCLEGDIEQVPPTYSAPFWGSLLPAAWSLMLALRARGLGAAWTTLHLGHAKQVAELLEIPPGISQGVLLPVAYSLGTDFKVAPRIPLERVVHRNRW
ncbi:MAG: nitroreductase family protein [Frankia sp.]